MADLSNQTVLAVKVESPSGTYTAPSSSDALRVADLRGNIAGLTSQIQEFTGSIHQPGPTVSGNTFEVTGRILLRGPGGSAPPAADAFVMGRILRAAGFSETVISTAIPASPEALAAGTTSQATLGSTPAGTLDLYKAAAVLFAGIGAGLAGAAMLRSYSASKVALLARLLGSALNTSNYQIPRQLLYRLDPSGTPPTLSVSIWHGNKRYNAKGCTVSSFRILVPTSSRDQTDPPSIEFTLTGTFESDADEASPTAPAATVAPPPFRAGQFWVDQKRLASSNFSIDLGAEVAYEPDPNEASGNKAAQLTRTTRTVQLTLSQVPKTTFDIMALANAQTLFPIEAMWGDASGNRIGLIVTDARLNFQSPDNSGPLVNTTGEAYIDGANRDIGLSFIYQ